MYPFRNYNLIDRQHIFLSTVAIKGVDRTISRTFIVTEANPLVLIPLERPSNRYWMCTLLPAKRDRMAPLMIHWVPQAQLFMSYRDLTAGQMIQSTRLYKLAGPELLSTILYVQSIADVEIVYFPFPFIMQEADSNSSQSSIMLDLCNEMLSIHSR
jgi:hypothetical protein